MDSEIIIIGGGLSAMSCAYHLENKRFKDYILLEKEPFAGGLCTSYQKEGFTFDFSGHLLHIATKDGLKLAKKLLGQNAALLKREAYVYVCDTLVPYPFQNNLAYLKEDIISQCVSGVLQAFREGLDPQKQPSFKKWALCAYGEGICKYFMLPYNSKLWRFDLDKMGHGWCAHFIPKNTLEDIIKGAYVKRKKDFGYNASFFYPKAGGCKALCDALLDKIKPPVLNAPVTRINLKDKTVTAAAKTYKYKKLVSTAPLKTLGDMIKGLPYALKRDFNALKHNNVYVLNIGFQGPTKNGHWFYFPEDKYPFYRVGAQSAFAQNMTPKNCSSLYVEFAFEQNAKKPNLKELETRAIALLRNLGFIGKEAKILVKDWLYIPYAYPIEDAQYEQARANIIDWLARQNIYLTGRYGAWEYSFMERSLLGGKQTAELLLKS